MGNDDYTDYKLMFFSLTAKKVNLLNKSSPKLLLEPTSTEQ